MPASKAGIGSEFGFSRAGGYTLSRSAVAGTALGVRTTVTSSGRAALGLAARYVKSVAGQAGETVLLPAYLCRSMIQPFEEAGLAVRFYPVADDLSIDPQAIVSRCHERTAAVLLMHYFGFPQRGLAGPLAARLPQVTLIDDRTHLLVADLQSGMAAGSGMSGSGAAIAIYSPRKWGPFPDLGITVWADAEQARMAASRWMERGYDWSFATGRVVGLALRAVFSRWPLESVRRLSLTVVHRADRRLDRRIRLRAPSVVSRLIWRHWDWISAWHARRENYGYLLKNWPSREARPLFEQLAADVCPLGFPIRSKNRDELKRALLSRRVFTPVHWERPPQVPAQEFPNAAALAEEELTIPIDQRYGRREMDCILEAVRLAS